MTLRNAFGSVATEETLATIKTVLDTIHTGQSTNWATATAQADALDALEALLAKLSDDPATSSDIATIAAKLSSDPATNTTLTAVLSKLPSDPATQATLASVLAKLSSDPATQTTLSAVLDKLPASPALNASVTQLHADLVAGVPITSLPALPPGNSIIGSIRLADGAGNALSTNAPSLPVAATVRALAVALHPSSPLPAGSNMVGQVQLRDGALGAAAVIKAASTAAATTDAALVVALSPNTPLPAGTNALGSVNITGQVGTNSRLYDSASGNFGAIKAASTAASATDASIVVAHSPNSPTPAGSNLIGYVGISSGANTIGTVTLRDTAGSSIETAAASSAAGVGQRALVTALSPNTPLPAGANTIGTVYVGNWAKTAAGAAAAVADQAIVVAHSPNSPTPAGTNDIGNVGGSSVSFNGTLTAASPIIEPLADVSRYAAVRIQMTSDDANGSLTFQGTDTGYWFNQQLMAANTGAPTASVTYTGTTGRGDAYFGALSGKRFRLNAALTAGTIAYSITYTTAPVSMYSQMVISGNSIGNVGLNTGSNTIGNVGIQTVSVAATGMGKAEDAVHTSGDSGVAIWGVRNDVPNVATTSNNGDYSQISTDQHGQVWTKPGLPTTTDPAITPFRNTAVSATPVLVKASQGRIKRYRVYNPNSAVAFVQIFSAATVGAAVLGTTTPLEEIPVPAGLMVENEFDVATLTTAGIVIAATTTAGGATAPTTGLHVQLWYA